MNKKQIKRLLKKSAADFVPDTRLDITGRENKDFSFVAPELPENYAPREKVSHHKHKAAFRFAAVVSLIIALFIGGFLGYMNFTEAQTVYLDINPSLSVTTNGFDKVSSVSCYNAEAEAMLKDSDLKGKKLTDALEIILDRAFSNGYLKGDGRDEILISVYGKDAQKNKSELSKIKNKLNKLNKEKNYKLNYDIGETKKDIRDEAKLYGISPAKYALIKEIIRRDGSYTVDDLKSLSIRELKNLLKK